MIVGVDCRRKPASATVTLSRPRKATRSRRPNPRLAKIYRNYTVDEIAKLFFVHKNTVRVWVKEGLRTNDDKRPMLILGRDLRVFLEVRRAKNKRPCGPGELYCVRCRVPQKAAGGMADCRPSTATLGDLIAICPACETLMHRRVSLAKLGPIRDILDITMLQALPHIVESPRPSVNSDLG